MNTRSKPKQETPPGIQKTLESPPNQSVPSIVPTVGLGASAGGLEALEQFFRHVPTTTGLAFVVIQHLDPTHKGLLPELLQRTTAMPVFQVRDRTQVKPDCVYVIPPNKDMSIMHGMLHLLRPSAPRGLRLPIDFFLCSLAEDLQERSIGVVLSGMGSDGTKGQRAIKQKNGLTLAQDPTSAKFDSMPRSVIDAGVADLVAPAEELPGMIIEYLRGASRITKASPPMDDKTQNALDKIIILLRAKTGHDFSMYKKNTLYRRIERRMGIHQIDKITSYILYLQKNDQELDLLFRELLIGVTNFFRDPNAWEHLQHTALPPLLAAQQSGGTLRAWSLGCSTGEEAYSLAIVFKEALEQYAPGANIKLRIFATDLDKDSIDRARQGLYMPNIANDVPAARLKRFFVQEGHGYRIAKEIREMVTFATQNVIMDPPFTKLDILICRNLLIYLTPELQRKLQPLFHYSLNPDGIMFLGSAEAISTSIDLFEPINMKAKLFRRRESFLAIEQVIFPASFVPAKPGIAQEYSMSKATANLQTLADQVLLQRFSPPAVLVNDKGDILYISGRTGKYLEPAAGKANWNIYAMAREGLRFDLGAAFQKAIRHKETVIVRGLKVGDGDSTHNVDITVQEIKDPEALRGMVMIIFTDVPASPKKRSRRSKPGESDNARIVELEQELQRCRNELQTTREEMQASQEELKSANEELQSTNEELQSTNEELTTSREEMQSLNEELQTVNSEQQSKLDDVSRVNNDMRNLLNSTEIVTIFLDNSLNVRRFTTGATKIFKLIPGDVGRPLSDIANELIYPDMLDEAQEVLRTLAFTEKQITTADDRWFSVRIMPYRTMEDVIGGLVLTFTNITTAKKLENELRAENIKLKQQLESGGVT